MIEEDVQLIHRILSGDDAAFTALVRKYQKSVHALAWRKIGDFHHAEEITQDTFLQVYNKLSTLKDPRQFAGWLYVMTSRRCSNWRRKHKSELQLLETAMEAIDKSTYTRYVSEQREAESAEHRQALVKKLLDKLPESERTVMTLYYLGEMTTREISRFLGVSVNTITSRLQRARRRLQENETLLIQETLGGVQLSADLVENITQKTVNMKSTPSPTTKPVIPWIAAGAAAILVLLMLGLSNKYLARFQRPYSFEAASEPTIEIIETLIVLDTDAKPALQNQFGRTLMTDETNSPGLQGSETAATPGASVDSADTVPWMPDPALRAAVREELALPAGAPLTQEIMLELHRLHASGKGITDLKGLEFAQNLVDLHLGDAGNYVTDLRPLAALTDLINLNVGGNQVSDVRPLTNLTHLTGLSLWNNQVTDISPLRSLTALTYLNLADNYVDDLRPLANLINLEKLDLFDNHVQNVAPLANLKSLKHLILTDNHIKDFSPLTGLMNLQALWIKMNPIQDLHPLSKLNLIDLKYDAVADPAVQTQPSEAWMPDPALRAVVRGEVGLLPDVPLTKEKMLRLVYLDAGGTGILDITGLEFATNLRELYLSENPITDLRPLANLTKLKVLHIGDVSPPMVNLDLHLLTNLINLETLSLRRNGILDIAPLSRLTKLRILSIEGNPIIDLSPLYRLNLRELDVSNSPLIDVRQLARLTALEYLCLENSGISDILPLAGLTKLRVLDIRHNAIEAVHPLSGLTALETLWVQGNPITDFTPLSKLKLTDFKYDVIEQTTQQTDPAEAWMPDAALRIAVRGEMGLLPDVPLTKEKMLRLQELKVSDKGIDNISGLEFATNLRELNLSRNPITDLRPLVNLINLEQLSLEDSKIADIRPLAELKRLRTLNIRDNAIRDITPLTGLVALRTLLTQGNPITDRTPLVGLNLTELD
ncbi:MAG: sigma-70 family RNA polymerase sigma factor [Candidatus Poribacteria bacterium]|nr:sigma-70 family RNA polymerase sigma factor [Candidatus Poribacteria bacterium]